MPALPVFTDRCGRVISDTQELHITDDHNNDELINDAILPGVHTAKTGGNIEIPGVDPGLEELPPTPAETEQDVDLDFTPAHDNIVDSPIVNMPTVTTQQPVSTDDGVCRSTRVCTQTKQAYIPSMTGKK